MKKLYVINTTNFVLKFENFSSPTHDIKYKVIDFDPSNKSIMAKKLPSSILEWFVRRIKSPLTR